MFELYLVTVTIMEKIIIHALITPISDLINAFFLLQLVEAVQ